MDLFKTLINKILINLFILDQNIAYRNIASTSIEKQHIFPFYLPPFSYNLFLITFSFANIQYTRRSLFYICWVVSNKKVMFGGDSRIYGYQVVFLMLFCVGGRKSSASATQQQFGRLTAVKSSLAVARGRPL